MEATAVFSAHLCAKTGCVHEPKACKVFVIYRSTLCTVSSRPLPLVPLLAQILKIRGPIGFCCELLLPIGFVILIAGLFRLQTITNNPTSAFTPSTWPLAPNPSTAYQRVPPAATLAFNLQYANARLALAPQSADNAAAVTAVNDLFSFINSTYQPFNGATVNGTGFISPLLRGIAIPPLAAQAVVFRDQAELESYVTSTSYGSAPYSIWGAIVINSGAPSWDYSIRMNSSFVPSTIAANSVNIVQRGVNTGPVRAYTWTNPTSQAGPNFLRQSLDVLAALPYPGFLTLQLLVDRWILSKAGAQPLPMSSMDVGSVSSMGFGTLMTMLATTARNPAWLIGNLSLECGISYSPACQSAAQWLVQAERLPPQTVDLIPFPVNANTQASIFTALTFIFGAF